VNKLVVPAADDCILCIDNPYTEITNYQAKYYDSAMAVKEVFDDIM
jgi:hypothetical protein